MTEPQDLILDILRKMQGDFAELKRDNRELKSGIARLERDLHSLRGDILQQAESIAVIDLRVERVETRMDLRDH